MARSKVIINADDTPEEIEEKIRKAFISLPLIMAAWDKYFDPSSNGRNPDSDSGSGGSNPSGSANLNGDDMIESTTRKVSTERR